MSDRPKSRLYLITPPKIENLEHFAKTLGGVIEAGDVACLQLRLKEASDAEILAAAAAIFPLAQDLGVACLVNDRPDLAKLAGADGVHIGQSDGTVAAARNHVGKDGIVGVTCHDSRHLAMEAAEAGADYVAFGAFFDTATKVAPTRANLDILSWWQEIMEIPCVAIGGINPENGAELVKAGADFLAVSAGLWSWPQGPIAASAAFKEMFDACA
ncbi:thiamine phosphate synthase [Aquidulcibacter paucihalophilus]|uniref:thiamine phosphate synthase n=1 Tax=Aquidulcibacter paucihalophilus TaxID=1978549 RepID=UPI000A197DF6|nr:thiamine phosphate synthase [Aquidulcibacter paucihalophilus]